MRSLAFLAAALSLAAPSVGWAQSAPNEIAAGFFTTLQTGDFRKAYSDVWRGTVQARKAADFDAIVAQTSSAFQLYGLPSGWEVVDEDEIAPSFRRHTYLVKSQIGPLFFRLQFYRRANEWEVYRIDFADDLARLP